jgi:hypothetical protein
MSDFATWEALIGQPEGIEHASATVKGTPELAVEAAMRRAEQKYGPQDWRRWRFRAELCAVPAELNTVHFVWADGELRRLGARFGLRLGENAFDLGDELSRI